MTDRRPERLTVGKQLAIQSSAMAVGGVVVFLLMRLMGEDSAYSARFAIIWTALMLVFFLVLGAVRGRRRSP